MAGLSQLHAQPRREPGRPAERQLPLLGSTAPPRPQAVRGYRRRDRAAYALYGLASLAFAVTLLTLLVRYW
ncbi:hypothetical protein GCM10027452_02860 [Micromonospora halotolerans]